MSAHGMILAAQIPGPQSCRKRSNLRRNARRRLPHQQHDNSPQKHRGDIRVDLAECARNFDGQGHCQETDQHDDGEHGTVPSPVKSQVKQQNGTITVATISTLTSVSR